MKSAVVILLVILPCLVKASRCEAFDSIANWARSDTLIAWWIPQIRVHDTFYPHPHMRDLKTAAKRGKILVITLIVSAGLTVLVSTAILRGGKDKEKSDTTRTIAPAELRTQVIAAAVVGRRELTNGRQQALNMALSAYASARGVERGSEELKYSPSVTCIIGGDRVTVIIPDDGASVEVRAACGNMGASAIADMEDGSIRSSIFTSYARKRETGI